MQEDRQRADSSRLERVFENILWYSRVIMLVPVVASIVLGIAAVCIATVEAISVVTHLGAILGAGANIAIGGETTNSLLASIISAVDVYLLAAILLIFGFGLYELFIGQIEPAQRATLAPRLLLIRSLDDLKERLAKVVLLVLVIEFLQYALRISIRSPLDLLELAVGIILVGGAVYLSTRRDGGAPPPTPHPP